MDRRTLIAATALALGACSKFMGDDVGVGSSGTDGVDNAPKGLGLAFGGGSSSGSSSGCGLEVGTCGTRGLAFGLNAILTAAASADTDGIPDHADPWLKWFRDELAVAAPGAVVWNGTVQHAYPAIPGANLRRHRFTVCGSPALLDALDWAIWFIDPDYAEVTSSSAACMGIEVDPTTINPVSFNYNGSGVATHVASYTEPGLNQPTLIFSPDPIPIIQGQQFLAGYEDVLNGTVSQHPCVYQEGATYILSVVARRAGVAGAASTRLYCSPEPTLRAFITSTSTPGNMGGRAGADAICQARANSQNFRGTFRAVIRTTEREVSDSLSLPDDVFNVRSERIALKGAFWNLYHTANIAYDETGTAVGGVSYAGIGRHVWTGLRNDRLVSSNCNNWTAPDGSGSIGLTGGRPWFIPNAGDECTRMNRLYCINQFTGQ